VAERARRLAQEYVRGIPDYDYKPGTLKFIRARPTIAGVDLNGANGDEDNGVSNVTNGGSGGGSSFEAFKGEGRSLKSKKKWSTNSPRKITYGR